MGMGRSLEVKQFLKKEGLNLALSLRGVYERRENKRLAPVLGSTRQCENSD